MSAICIAGLSVMHFFHRISVPLWLLVAGSAMADIRDHVRLKGADTAAVTQSQAVDLTLTLTDAAVRPIQTWVRADGVIDTSGKVLTAYLSATEAAHVSIGQRARAFSVDSKASMFQARITRVTAKGSRLQVEATLSGAGHDTDARYLLEIITERGEFLSVPNEAIIEEGDRQIVYVQRPGGDYEPRNINTGLQGERYTQVLQGLSAGEQVVTTGSFFIDAEYKMKGGN